MKSDLEKAESLMIKNGCTCVLCKGDKIYTDTERGLKPLIKLIDSGEDLKDFSAADIIVGKAAAMLYVLLGVSAVYARVMSEGGIDMLKRNGITAVFDKSVKEIRNRADTGMCPMEEAVKDIEKPSDGLSAIKNKIAAMRKTV